MRTLVTRRASGAGIAVLVSMAALISACGGNSAPLSAPAVKTQTLSGSQIVLASVQTTAAAKSAHVSLSVSTKGTGPLAFSMTTDGAVDFASGDSQFKMDLGGMTSSFLPGGLEVRVVNKVAYVKLPALIGGFFGGSGGEKWIAIDASKAPGGSNPLSNVGQSDPTKFLAALENVSDDVKEVGTDTVRGVETKHYHVTLDLGKAVDQAKVPQSLRDKVKGLMERGGAPAPTIPADVWVDRDGHVRRMTLELNVGSLGGLGAGAGGATGSPPTVSVSLEMYDFGAPVNVQAPPADQIVQLPEFGGLGGLGLPKGLPSLKVS